MADIRQVTDKFAVAPQISEEDFAIIAEKGYKLVINNRPEGETPDQLSSEVSAKLAQTAGLDYKQIPFAGPPPEDAIKEMMEILKTADTPIFAHCRSGTRSIMLWAIASVKLGQETPQSALDKALAAGYDLSNIAPLLA